MKTKVNKKIVITTLILISIVRVLTILISFNIDKPIKDPCENVTGYDTSGDVALSLKSLCYNKALQENKIKDIRLCDRICISEDPDEKSLSDQFYIRQCKQKCINEMGD